MRERLRLQRKVEAKASSTPVQTRRLFQQPRNRAAFAPVPPLVHRVLRGPGQPLDAATQGAMQTHLGHDFGSVRVHADAHASASAEALGASAYTVGRDVVFGAGHYAPETIEGKRLLAHELTHVVQQTTTSGPPTPYAQAENEAEQNSRRLAAGAPGHVRSATPPGLLQRQGKPKASASGERTGTKEGQDKFSFKAELTVPLTDELKLGKVSFLDDLKLTGTGGFLGTPLLGVSPAEFEDVKLQMALTLAKLELESVKKKEEALRKGKLSFGTTLSASGGPTFSFDPSNVAGSLGTTLTTKFSATTPSLIPSSVGTLTLGTSVSGAGSLTQTLGPDAKSTPKGEAKAGVSADFKSAPSRHPALTLGGVLGDKASVTAGLTGSASGSITPEATTGKLSGGLSLGLAGKGGGVERFIKLQVTGDISINQATGSATTTTKSLFLGLSTGFKF